jgi:uncharacterized membrane protein YkoI
VNLVLILLALVTACSTVPALSHDGVDPDVEGTAWEDENEAHDRARRAVRSGEILPMAALLQRVRERIPGDVVEVELEDGRWLYEFKVIDDKGRLLEVLVDARTGRVLSIEDD